MTSLEIKIFVRSGITKTGSLRILQYFGCVSGQSDLSSGRSHVLANHINILQGLPVPILPIMQASLTAKTATASLYPIFKNECKTKPLNHLLIGAFIWLSPETVRLFRLSLMSLWILQEYTDGIMNPAHGASWTVDQLPAEIERRRTPSI